MTLQDTRYRRLARESSNCMLAHDGELAQGNIIDAALAIWRAGLLRLQMAHHSRSHHDEERAVADALSAASCFIKAANVQWAYRAVQMVSDWPRDRRPDLCDARLERQFELLELVEKQHRFSENWESHWDSGKNPTKKMAQHLHQQLLDFPGWPRLHFTIATIEDALGDFDVAAKHALLALNFEPGNSFLACVAVLALAKISPLPHALRWGEQQLGRFHNVELLQKVVDSLRSRWKQDQQGFAQALRRLRNQPILHRYLLQLESAPESVANGSHASKQETKRLLKIIEQNQELASAA